MAAKLSKIEIALLSTAIVGGSANAIYFLTRNNPSEDYLWVSGLIIGAMLIEPIGRAIYQDIRQSSKTRQYKY